MSGNGHEADSVAQIKVIGVGGGGSNAVSRMHRDGMNGIEYMIVNTDAQALKQADVPVKIRIGDHLTDGKGGGGKPEMGAMAAEESRVELHEALRGADMTFIAAGMGGGTGTGAAPVIAEMARECGALSVGVVTRPFEFEGAKRAEVAETGIAELRSHLDTLIVIPNERVHLLYHEGDNGRERLQSGRRRAAPRRAADRGAGYGIGRHQRGLRGRSDDHARRRTGLDVDRLGFG